jgi:hypothetical protein
LHQALPPERITDVLRGTEGADHLIDDHLSAGY